MSEKSCMAVEHLMQAESEKLAKYNFNLSSGQETVPPQQRRSGHGGDASGSESLASRAN